MIVAALGRHSSAMLRFSQEAPGDAASNRLIPFLEKPPHVLHQKGMTVFRQTAASRGVEAVLEQQQLLVKVVKRWSGPFFVSLERRMVLGRHLGVVQRPPPEAAIGEGPRDAD